MSGEKTALITGITGQDGSYLAELLISKGYNVHGLIRRASSNNTHRINHLLNTNINDELKLNLHYGDLTDSASITNLINKIEPDEIYNLAAQSDVRLSFDIPEYTAETSVTVNSTFELAAVNEGDRYNLILLFPSFFT